MSASTTTATTTSETTFIVASPASSSSSSSSSDDGDDGDYIEGSGDENRKKRKRGQITTFAAAATAKTTDSPIPVVSEVAVVVDAPAPNSVAVETPATAVATTAAPVVVVVAAAAAAAVVADPPPLAQPAPPIQQRQESSPVALVTLNSYDPASSSVLFIDVIQNRRAFRSNRFMPYSTPAGFHYDMARTLLRQATRACSSYDDPNRRVALAAMTELMAGMLQDQVMLNQTQRMVAHRRVIDTAVMLATTVVEDCASNPPLVLAILRWLEPFLIGIVARGVDGKPSSSSRAHVTQISLNPGQVPSGFTMQFVPLLQIVAQVACSTKFAPSLLVSIHMPINRQYFVEWWRATHPANSPLPQAHQTVVEVPATAIDEMLTRRDPSLFAYLAAPSSTAMLATRDTIMQQLVLRYPPFDILKRYYDNRKQHADGLSYLICALFWHLANPTFANNNTNNNNNASTIGVQNLLAAAVAAAAVASAPAPIATNTTTIAPSRMHHRLAAITPPALYWLEAPVDLTVIDGKPAVDMNEAVALRLGDYTIKPPPVLPETYFFGAPRTHALKTPMANLTPAFKELDAQLRPYFDA